MQVALLFRHVAAAAVACLVLASPRTASALAFEPTESEWATWPPYCQARYMDSGAGRNSDTFAGRIPEGQVRAWKAKLGVGWVGLHHHCAGVILVQRAKWEKDPRVRNGLLQRVLRENSFALDRLPFDNPMRARIAAHNGITQALLRDFEAAEKEFDDAINGCPTCTVGYYSKAQYLQDEKKLAEAREVLEKGVSATDGAAELHYFLGLILVDLKDFDSAQKHAQLAYEKGYPLPGLRKRLADAGYKID